MDAIWGRNDQVATSQQTYCDDCSLLVEGDVTLLMFHRTAESLQAAIRSAITDVNELGYHVSHVEMEPDSVMPQTM